MKVKRYLPVTYVDEDGIVYTKQQLINKIYKSYGTEIIEQKESYGPYRDWETDRKSTR